MVKMLIGLAALMLANIFLGTSISKLKKSFKKDKLKNGTLKAIFIFIGISFMWLCGYLNPDVVTVEFQGIVVNVETAMTMIIKAAMGTYFVLDINKLAKVFGVKISENDLKEKSDS